MESTLLELIRTGGVSASVVILALVLGGMRGIYVFGWVYRETVERLEHEVQQAQREATDWRDAYLGQHGVSDQAIQTLRTVAERRREAP